MRLALGIEYDGSDFLGWQRLSHGRTVQRTLEEALGRVAHAAIEVVCAGRTDSGVHALQQVVHFDSPAQRSDYGWMMGCNSVLPAAAAARPGLMSRYLTWERRPLDVGAMHRAAQVLLGEHDFSAFRSAACQAPHARRRMLAVRVFRRGEEVQVEVEANAFLHHMVRNIVGSLLPIGRGERPVDWLAEVLGGRDRGQAGPTAPPQGLCFIGPRYPEQFAIPEPEE